MDLITNLVGYYPLEESSGNILTQAGSVVGIPYGTPTRQQNGKKNKCYLFTGNNSVCFGDNAFRFTTDFTISMWFCCNSPGVLFSRYFSSTGYRCYYMAVGADGQVMFIVFNTSNVVTSVLSPVNTISINMGVWYHVVFVKSGSNMKIFINNSVVANTTNAPTNIRDQQGSGSNIKTYLACVAKSNTVPDSFFQGYIDEVGLWDIGLTDNDVATLWNDGVGKFYPFQPVLTTVSVPNPTYPVYENGVWVYSTAQNNYELPDVSYNTTGQPSTAIDPFSHWKFIDGNDKFEFFWFNNVCFNINQPIIISFKQINYYSYDFPCFIRCWYDSPTGSPSVIIQFSIWNEINIFSMNFQDPQWVTFSINITDHLISNNVDFSRIKKIGFETNSSTFHYRNTQGNEFLLEPYNRYIVDISSTCYLS